MGARPWPPLNSTRSSKEIAVSMQLHHMTLSVVVVSLRSVTFDE